MNKSVKVDLILSEKTRADLAVITELRKILPWISRNRLKQLFKDKGVFIGEKVLSPSFIFPPGTHTIVVTGIDSSSEPEIAKPSPRGSFVPVLFENGELLILYKPEGVPSVPHSSGETDTAVNSALAHFPALAGIGDSMLEPGLVHRLDTHTSGILVFAKSQQEWLRLKNAWKSRTTKKIYRAVVSPGRDPSPIAKTPLELHPFLAHDIKSAKRMLSLGEDLANAAHLRYRGKPLPTSTTILKARTLPGEEHRLLDLEIQIETGVMHQIRATLASLGWPVVGDVTYNGKKAERLLLHAWKLSFEDAAGQPIEISAPLPANWPG